MKNLNALVRLIVVISVMIGFPFMISGAHAGEAAVLDATVIANPNGTYAVSATIFHKDEGWSHYVDKFDVLTPAGKVIATRILFHPHVNEQPFTRSIADVQVPIGVTEITIRAHDLVHGDGARTFKVKLPRRK